MVCRARDTGLEVRGCRSLQRLVCQHWALNMIQAATDSQWREGGDTGEFAEVEGSSQMSCTGAKGSTLTGWLQGNC